MVDDREDVRTLTLDTVAELRELIARLRADPTVRRYLFGPCDELDTTEEPTHCACGRELHGVRLWAAEFTWRPCVDCPGHGVFRCRNCHRKTVWPVPRRDCAPSSVDRRRRPPPYPGGDVGRRRRQAE